MVVAYPERKRTIESVIFGISQGNATNQGYGIENMIGLYDNSTGSFIDNVFVVDYNQNTVQVHGNEFGMVVYTVTNGIPKIPECLLSSGRHVTTHGDPHVC